MIQGGDGAHLSLEAVTESLGGDFDSDLATHTRIPRPVDLAHAAGAERREHLVVA
jgi:hypothetical protein